MEDKDILEILDKVTLDKGVTVVVVQVKRGKEEGEEEEEKEEKKGKTPTNSTPAQEKAWFEEAFWEAVLGPRSGTQATGGGSGSGGGGVDVTEAP